MKWRHRILLGLVIGVVGSLYYLKQLEAPVSVRDTEALSPAQVKRIAPLANGNYLMVFGTVVDPWFLCGYGTYGLRGPEGERMWIVSGRDFPLLEGLVIEVPVRVLPFLQVGDRNHTMYLQAGEYDILLPDQADAERDPTYQEI